MSNLAPQKEGQITAPKTIARTVNFDHICDIEKLVLWHAYRSAKQHFIDLDRVGL